MARLKVVHNRTRAGADRRPLPIGEADRFFKNTGITAKTWKSARQNSGSKRISASGLTGSGLDQQIVRDPSQRLSAKAARRTPRVAPSCAPMNPPIQPQGSPTQSPTSATASAVTKKANSNGSPPSFPGIRKYTAPSNNRLGYRRTLSLYFTFVTKRDRRAWASSALGTLLITLP